jgi:hypothetical protein
MTADDWVFLLACLNASTSLGAACIVAWTRHGEADEEQELIPSPIVRFVYGADSSWITTQDRDDLLTEMDKQRFAEMVESGAALSRRSALAYGIGRADWERICHGLARVGVAEYGHGRALALNSSAWEYLRIPSPAGWKRQSAH